MRARLKPALAIHRETGNRRSEGSALGPIGSLLSRDGRMQRAVETVAAGERLLRAVGSSIELGKLLRARTEIELQTGNAEAARTTLAEAEALADTAGAVGSSELGRELAWVRTARQEREGV